MTDSSLKLKIETRVVASVATGFALLLVIFHALTALLPHNSLTLSLESVGTSDFVQYWAGFHLLNDGGNPYDGVQMHAEQLKVGQSADKTVLMWNPPWLTLLLAPILTLPFPYAAICWGILNIGMIVTIARIAAPALGFRSLPVVFSGIATILFYPLTECLRYGQLSIFLTFAFTLFIFFARAGWLGAAALALLPLTTKPHLFLLFVPPAIVWLTSLAAADRRRFLCTAALGMAVICSATAILWPSALANWLASFSVAPRGPGVIAREEWKTATLATLIRTSIATDGGELPVWPMWAVPTVAFVATALYFLNKRQVDWSSLAPSLLCLSLGTSSYGWAYDQSLLVLCQIALICRALRPTASRRALALGGVAVVQLIAFYIASRADNAQHYFLWLPWALLALLLATEDSGERHASNVAI